MSSIKSIKNMEKQLVLICSFPIVVLMMQIIHPTVVLILGLILFAFAIAFPLTRTILLTYSFTILGYLFWLFTSDTILNNFYLSPLLSKTVGRFGLIGYLLLFAIWYRVRKPQNKFLRHGDSKAIIRFPFVWKGIKETEWRFTLIFSMMCSGVICFFAFTTNPSYNIILYGTLFSVVNAILEEFLWRGFILTRFLDVSNEKVALIVSALAFGLYHYSLQFPIWACFIFAVGGFYMGGSAIKSKGLLSPIIMHIMVNLIFVFCGVIF